ncbi:MAG: hypothetical protein DHS20C10_13640 [marine bacterium B5-7]|nr:MAG: hypothetical protein DHS20C10_13640 [marine bacterium B5-7]
MDKGQLYAIPKKIVKQYVVETKRALTRPGNVSAEDMFASHDKKYTRAGALLKGLRAREGLSQVVFAKRIGVSQANLSKMENGARPIGMTIAKRIAKSFDVNVNYFSE